MTLPPYLTARDGGVWLALKVQPRASKNEFAGLVGNELKIKVTAPPVDAAANEAVLRLLAATLGCPRGAIHLVRGHTSRHKQVVVRGLVAADVAARLGG